MWHAVALVGVAAGTMVRDEALWFSRIGTFLERADATSRLLEARWREADALAKVADSLFLPRHIEEELESIRRSR